MFMALSGGLGQLNEVSVAILRYISCYLVHDIEKKPYFLGDTGEFLNGIL